MKLLKKIADMLILSISIIAFFVSIFLIYIACITTAVDEPEEVVEEEEIGTIWVDDNGELIDKQRLFS